MNKQRPLLGADSRVVCERCAVADTPLPRMRGLLGRRELPADEGILLRPAPSIHTFFMRFPIDVVFLDAHLRVLRVAADVKPWRAAACRGARSVLELAAGEAARRSIRVGEALRFDDVGKRNPVTASRPISVVLAAADPPFLNIASFLLARDGFEVEPTRDQGAVCDVVARWRPDVVVYDAGDATPPTVQSISELSTRHPDVGIVVVSEAPNDAAAKLGALPKWGTFARLRDEIERAHLSSRGFWAAAHDA